MLSKLVIAGIACLAGSLAIHQDLKPQDAKGAPKQPTAEEVKAMMEAYEKAGAPGEQHKLLAKLAGKWETVNKPCDMPGFPSVETKGTADARVILGGRQLVEESTGMAQGKPFSGIFMLGYDNTLKEYVATWSDNMSTGQYTTHGTADAAGKVITLNGEIRDAMSPEKGRPWRIVIKIESDDKHTVEVYDTISEGNIAVVMTSTATRVK